MWPALWFCKNCHWIWEACLQETYDLIIMVNNSFWGLATFSYVVQITMEIMSGPGGGGVAAKSDRVEMIYPNRKDGKTGHSYAPE